MENVRFVLVIALAFLGLMIWEAWQADYGRAPAVVPVADSAPRRFPRIRPSDPHHRRRARKVRPRMPLPACRPARRKTPAIAAHGRARPDPVDARRDAGARCLASIPGQPRYAGAAGRTAARSPPKVFVYQSGLAGDRPLPTHHDRYASAATHFELAADAEELVVPLTWQGDDGITVVKRYRLRRGDYRLTLEYEIRNDSAMPVRVHHYDQLKRNDESSRQGLVYTFTGAVLSTPEKRFEKFDFGDLKDAPLNLTVADGWVGIMQHYFVSALIPPAGVAYQYYSKIVDGQHYLVGYMSQGTTVAPGTAVTLTSTLFVGPKRHDLLDALPPGLELTVDYGILWFIAKPLFVVLEFIHDLTGNWGWGIIILTILLKLVFFPLSAAGYRSMANMRRVQPRMIALRDRYKDDRAQLNQAMMKLYKDEKINPLGGCLPILIQIPVFIALYWVLLETVEMRQASFVLWIQDLSTRDPGSVLPLLMGISMWAQQKLNPAPLDPMQAKVMQILPFVFTVFFAFFPAGLVLYWLVNNILSILQQWQITRSIEHSAS